MENIVAAGEEGSEKENVPLELEEPMKKKRRKSLSLRKRRFGQSVSENLSELTKPIVPKNTKKNTSWALRNFNDWRAERERHYPQEVCRSDLFEHAPWNIEELNHWLTIYVLETRRADGQRYPLTTVYQLLSGILRHMRSIDPECPNFLDKNNYHFKELHGAVDNLGRQLRIDGVGAEVKHASVVTSEEEAALWENGVLSTENPKALLSAVFYCNGKNFCLRGGCEHRNLKLSQLKRLYDPDRYVYTENGSKNRSGCLIERSVENKCVPIFSCFNEPKFGESKCKSEEATAITPLPFPTFGVLKHCVVNINYGTYGPSNASVQSQSVLIY